MKGQFLRNMFSPQLLGGNYTHHQWREVRVILMSSTMTYKTVSQLTGEKQQQQRNCFPSWKKKTHTNRQNYIFKNQSLKIKSINSVTTPESSHYHRVGFVCWLSHFFSSPMHLISLNVPHNCNIKWDTFKLRIVSICIYAYMCGHICMSKEGFLSMTHLQKSTSNMQFSDF